MRNFKESFPAVVFFSMQAQTKTSCRFFFFFFFLFFSWILPALSCFTPFIHLFSSTGWLSGHRRFTSPLISKEELCVLFGVMVNIVSAFCPLHRKGLKPADRPYALFICIWRPVHYAPYVGISCITALLLHNNLSHTETHELSPSV